jgi:hypothetical protein
MPTPLGRALPLIIIGAAVAVAVGVTAVIDRFATARDATPAAPGTPQVGSRLPIALWPSDGTEPVVAHGLGGWREMSAALYHRDTTVDDGARARAVVIAEHPRREQDTRRELALEAHVLLGDYEPALVAAAWLSPLLGVRLDQLSAFGMSDVTVATLRAVARIDEDPELVSTWRRELGIDVVSPRVTPAIVAETPDDRRGMLWAVLLSLAGERVAERHAMRAGP